ncbi:MAG: hypothetical protein QM689_10390 [Oscillospiraceae bacterium]
MSGKEKRLKAAQWGCVASVILGAMICGIGIFCGGLQTVHYLFWQ